MNTVNIFCCLAMIACGLALVAGQLGGNYGGGRRPCPPVCANFCRFGRVYRRGCPTCECKPRPVFQQSCPPGSNSEGFCNPFSLTCAPGANCLGGRCCRPSRPGPQITCPSGSVSTGVPCSGFTIPGTNQCPGSDICQPGPADGGVCCRSLAPPNQCPPNTRVGICQFRVDNCLSDLECAPGQRCCQEGCGKVCKSVGGTYTGPPPMY